MKRLIYIIVLSVSILFSNAFVNQLKAQESSTRVESKAVAASPNGFTKNWFFGVKGGATFFLSPLKDNLFSWGASATLGKQINSKIAIRADYMYANLKSEGHFIKENNDGSYYKNDLKANVDLMEIALIAKFSLNDFLYAHSPKYLREIYIFTGGAYIMYNSKITDKDDNFLMGSGYSAIGEKEAMETGFAVPIGFGITYKLDKADRFNFNAEFGYRYEQTNGLNGGLNDNATQYTYTSLGFLYNIGKPTITPQRITSDIVKDELEAGIDKKIDKDLKSKVDTQIKPMQEELKKQSVAVADNQAQLEILQEEIEARTNAIKEQLTMSQAGGGGTASYRGGIMNLNSVYFAFNSTYITSAMQREIALIARVLKKDKNLKCHIIGNSSSVGSPEYNKQLSQKRAESVKSLLSSEFKIDESRLDITNNGLEDPLAEDMKKINRRVDLIIY